MDINHISFPHLSHPSCPTFAPRMDENGEIQTNGEQKAVFFPFDLSLARRQFFKFILEYNGKKGRQNKKLLHGGLRVSPASA